MVAVTKRLSPVVGNRFGAYATFEPTKVSPTPLNERPKVFRELQAVAGYRRTGVTVDDRSSMTFYPAPRGTSVDRRRRGDMRHALVVRGDFAQMLT